ncbi:hypothetical protein GCM10028807_06710 [Spirosoma daeguense]
MQQTVFTCQYLLCENVVCSVHWLRIVLDNVQYGPKQLRLLRLNEKFVVDVKPFRLTDELNTLYRIYRNYINFDAPETISSCLLNGSTNNVFDTQMVEVRDEGKLIAVGIFDNGLRTIAGIMNFYDPDYKKHSLGKFLMLMKMKYAQQQQKEYYYPGYMVHKYPKFDYKLFACEPATEVYDDNTGLWIPFSWETVVALSAELMGEE